jgi:hypothetical protein
VARASRRERSVRPSAYCRSQAKCASSLAPNVPCPWIARKSYQPLPTTILCPLSPRVQPGVSCGVYRKCRSVRFVVCGGHDARSKCGHPRHAIRYRNPQFWIGSGPWLTCLRQSQGTQATLRAKRTRWGPRRAGPSSNRPTDHGWSRPCQD